MTVQAEEETDDTKEKEAIKYSYHRLYPDILTNLKPRKHVKQQRYLLIRTDVQTDSPEKQKMLEYYEPLYRDKIILFINRHTVGNLNTSSKKKIFSKKLIKLINNAIYKEIKQKPVTNVLFTRFIIE